MNWSFSKLMTFESCAFRYKLQYIEKQPQLPLPPDNPMERGNRIHKNLELFVKGEGALAGNEARHLEPFKPALGHLQMLFANGHATAEENWKLDRDWEFIDPDTQYNNPAIWLWAKLDFNVTDEENSLVITGDYKSGKSKYKAIEHVQQGQLYVALSALRFPWANKHQAELWYVDEGHVRSASYTREDALRYIGLFQRRADRIDSEKLFRPNPNINTCRYCPFGKANGTGYCPVSA